MDSAQTHLTRENRARLLSRLTMAICLVGVAACSPFSSAPVAPGNPSAEGSTQPGTALTPVAANEFVFPQNSCGDRVTNPSTTWYPVYIDGANIEDIRTKYCRDAVSTIRAISGQPSVQVASFTSYDKALRFSKLVGGEVEQLGNSLVTAPGQASPAATASPGMSTAAGLPSPSGASTSTLPSTTRPQAAGAARSGTLTASDPGSPINVRTSASTSAEVQHTGYPGDRLRIVSQSQGDDGSTWYNVQLESGQTGWVRSDFVSSGAARPSTTTSPGSTALRPSPTGATTSATASSSNRQGALTAAEPDAAINVRDGAGMSASVQDVAYSGDAIRILGQQQGDDGSTWYNVQLESGQTGWVRSDFVSQ